MVVQAAGIAMIDSYRGMRKVVFGGRGLCKTYGSVTALDGVDIDVYEREIVAVVGDNGAGKSTLVRVLSGLEYPDDGCVLRNGEEISFSGVKDANAAGVCTIFQNPAMAPAMDVADMCLWAVNVCEACL